LKSKQNERREVDKTGLILKEKGLEPENKKLGGIVL